MASRSSRTASGSILSPGRNSRWMLFQMLRGGTRRSTASGVVTTTRGRLSRSSSQRKTLMRRPMAWALGGMASATEPSQRGKTAAVNSPPNSLRCLANASARAELRAIYRIGVFRSCICRCSVDAMAPMGKATSASPAASDLDDGELSEEAVCLGVAASCFTKVFVRSRGFRVVARRKLQHGKRLLKQFRFSPNRRIALSVCLHALSYAKPLRTFAGNAFFLTHCPTQNRFALLLEMLVSNALSCAKPLRTFAGNALAGLTQQNTRD